METLIVTPDLDLRFEDLVKKVETYPSFTLRDVLRASVSSSQITPSIMSEMLHCDCIDDFWAECESQVFEPDKHRSITCLRLTWTGEKFIGDKQQSWFDNYWEFNGVNEKNGQSYCLSLAPTWRVADFNIRVGRVMEINDFNSEDMKVDKIRFQPSVTVFEMLFAVFFSLGTFGGPGQRDEMLEHFIRSLKSSKDSPTELVPSLKQPRK